MRKILLVYFLLLPVVSLFGQQINIIPQPAEIKIGKGVFNITSKTEIAFDGSNKGAASYLSDFLRNNFAIELEMVKEKKASTNIISIVKSSDQGKKGYYKLDCNSKGITISGDQEGIFYAIQTLSQLLVIPVSDKNEKLSDASINVPQVSIVDYPRFQYRGMHLDVCRHFFPVSFVKQYIDYLALHKLNKFHWHLTEDQGWRIQIKKYPKLTEVGAWRNGTIIGRYPGKGNDNIYYGGYYTQEEIKEVVQYAAERYIEVIPEIEMPGHSSAAIAAYPWLSCFPEKPTDIPARMISQKSIDEQKNGRIKLVQETWGVFDDIFCAGKDSTFMFLQNVIDEVVPLFPSKYFHIGGDEAPKVHWKKCPQCQQRMKDLGLKDEHELQSYFVQRIEKYLNSKGKTLIGWDEILEGGLAPNAVVMSWRGEQGGIEAAKQNHDVIMTPGNPVYFDHSQSENEDSVTIGGYNSIEKVYAYDPIPAALNEEQGEHVLGAQANVWTEYMDNSKKVEYMIFPRMAALSEILWTPKEKRNWDSFEKRLPEQMKRYENWGANYSKAYFDLKTNVIPTDNYSGVLWKVESKFNKPITINFNRADSIWTYSKPQLITKEVNKAFASLSIENKQISVIQTFHFNKATGKKIILTTPPSKNYPGDGAFTLVNGVQNEKGLARSKEFLGFSGIDCEAIIDLGKEEKIGEVKAHILEQTGSWIYKPADMIISVSTDGENFIPVSCANPSITDKQAWCEFLQPTNARYVKVLLKNFGTIPDGNPGTGNKAWLFVDEIEIN